ncbi:hypothetical protein AB8989_18415 [Yersinia hibernica]|uniref:Lipoprotein n=1 Tax=Yersinia hibernica TaxID=2339259 RepID=A0ABX5R412_9GAMM|nr:hypothetical protein [Yersinia hibernica]QAX80390.1 hypothetical protein D5F51_18770 [Yersinia hibernica]
MKYFFNTRKNFYSHCFILFLALFLSGCSHLAGITGSHNGDYLQGNIQSSHGEIPENATITLSITQSKAAGGKELSLQEYSIVTPKESLTIPFRLQLPNELSLSSQPLNISVRVEKEGELIMMSDRLTPFLRQPGEKLILTVNDS